MLTEDGHAKIIDFGLANLRSALGRAIAKAAEYYRRCLQYWGDGDMDRERVTTARARL